MPIDPKIIDDSLEKSVMEPTFIRKFLSIIFVKRVPQSHVHVGFHVQLETLFASRSIDISLFLLSRCSNSLG